MPATFHYGIDELNVEKTIGIDTGKLKAVLNPDAVKRIRKSQDDVASIVANNKTVYGVNTGFGILANTKISEEDTAILQHKILQSHSVGVGKPIPIEIAKIMLITKVHALAKGFSGIRLETLERIIWFIENDIIPVVPEKGSVGASGDLAPLAHLFLPLIGLGELYTRKNTNDKEYTRSNTMDVLQQKGLAPLRLGPKEGLALINGTQFILSFAVKAVQRMHNCLEAADIIGAMSLEALTGTKSPFDERLHDLRPFEC